MLEPEEQRVVEGIAKYGWHDLGVEEYGRVPGFNYTIGLMQTYDHPEVIIFGLTGKLRHGVLWGIVRDIHGGLRFDKQGLYDSLLQGFACASRPVHPSQHPYYLGYAMWHCRHRGLTGQLVAVQCFWPGKVDGKFPWEDGCSEEVRRRQPLLYLPK
jgi:hypothetical protein